MASVIETGAPNNVQAMTGITLHICIWFQITPPLCYKSITNLPPLREPYVTCCGQHSKTPDHNQLMPPKANPSYMETCAPRAPRVLLPRPPIHFLTYLFSRVVTKKVAQTRRINNVRPVSASQLLFPEVLNIARPPPTAPIIHPAVRLVRGRAEPQVEEKSRARTLEA
ncbi:hypothetical protein BS47DRAFT_1383906 [Hydnum rufescens UP504]|uniref:Uncharacterized protein n=1 Tax=Hydnum rufescens UP504 TaxID=1448309 RepID=A0A9P6ARG0_9AGAM|nr:hypothetical protein BS47DRAFT_1383906 [Hydnum rufescens UP504]